MQSPDIEALNEQIYIESKFLDDIYEQTANIVVGQRKMIDRLLLGLLTKGHVLLEGLPGLAKTLAIRTLAGTVDSSFQRIQFTPDLLPSDIIGTMIYQPENHQFSVQKGPIFSNFILADEINRAPAKVQSALLEAMQEKQVTIGKETFKLEEPFLVLATQNPIEQEGTYPLPEAQMDRFMFKVVIDYPARDEELHIMRRNLDGSVENTPKPVVHTDQILRARKTVDKIYMDEKIENYILNLVWATREPQNFKLEKLKPLINYGASPRGSINLAKASKAYAFLQRRGFVIPDDIKAVCHDILRHRIGLSYEAEAENILQENIIDDILNTVEVP